MKTTRRRQTALDRGGASISSRERPASVCRSADCNHRFLGGAMIRKRKLGNLAAIGGLTASIAMLTGFSAARADELADLRANQLLLQQRIDQLAQAQAQGGPPSTFAAPGTTGAAAYGTAAVPGAGMVGGSFPAVVSDPRHRHFDPRRRLCQTRRSTITCRTVRPTARRTRRSGTPAI